MRIINPLQMNDWNMKKFFIVVFSFQLLVIGLILLDQLKVQIPIIRQILSFIYITFIPGMILLRIFKQHGLGNVKTVLYSIGLSLSFLMVTGFLLNIIYPVLGYENPFNLQNVLLMINLGLYILLILSYYFDQDYCDIEPKLNIIFKNIWKTISICILPFIAIFGTFIFNNFGNNNLQMFLLLVLSLLPMIISFNKIPKNLIPVVVYSASLSLLFYTALISPHVWGSDINKELLILNSIIENARWDITLAETINSMLSISALGPIYSIFLDLNPVNVLKVLYPFLFAFVPLGLFEVYKEQMDDKDAFLSAFFFISVFTFFTTMLALARQQIAEIFLMLIILLIVDKNLNKTIKSIFLIIFGSSLVVSHYGLSYIFLLILGLSLIIIFISKKYRENIKNFNMINLVFPLFFLVIIISWYMYLAASSSLESGLFVSKTIFTSMTDLLNPQSSTALNIATAKLPFLQNLDRNLYLLSEFFILVGIIGVIIKDKDNFRPEFKILSIGAVLVSIISIAVPNFSAALNTDRIIHISFFFLSPFFVLGFKIILDLFNKVLKAILKYRFKKYLPLISAFLILFFLLNTGFLYQVFDQDKLGRFALDESTDYMTLNRLEISSIEWYEEYGIKDNLIYADVYKQRLIYGMTSDVYEEDKTNIISMYYAENYTNTTFESRLEILNSSIKNQSYLFLGSYNIENEEIIVISRRTERDYTKTRFIYIPINDFSVVFNKIYDNGGSNLVLNT